MAGDARNGRRFPDTLFSMDYFWRLSTTLSADLMEIFTILRMVIPSRSITQPVSALGLPMFLPTPSLFVIIVPLKCFQNHLITHLTASFSYIAAAHRKLVHAAV